MTRRKGEGHFDRIMAYIEKHVGQITSYENTIERLRAHPPGFRRALCIYFSDADIDNGGFKQYYHNGFGCMTMSAIEGYERLGAGRMAQIMKSSLYVCLHSRPEVAARTRLEMPASYLDGFSPLAATFEQLDTLHYEEAERLPGAADVDSCYPLGAIDFYYEKYPEDFGR